LYSDEELGSFIGCHLTDSVDIVFGDFTREEGCELGVKVDEIFPDWPAFFLVGFQKRWLSEAAEDKMEFMGEIHGVHH
jgi:hypothetical protein